MVLRAIGTMIIPIALISQGLGVNTPIIFSFLPDYRDIFCRLWERHKNPISWVCRPFFGLVIGYGAILQSWEIILLGVLGIGTSWFWFPKWKNTPAWAEEFINKEFEVLTPDNHWDLRRVVLPSIGLPLGLAGLACLLWYLSYPWNWVGILILVVVTVLKIVWSARLQRSVFKPVTWVTLIGFGLGVVVGALLFAFRG
jgi:hypothetical protein